MHPKSLLVPFLAALPLPSLADQRPPWRDELLSFHRSLVSIPSVSGNESAVGDYLAQWLTEHGFTVQLQIVPPAVDDDAAANSRFNVIAWPSSGSDDAGGNGTRPVPRVLVTSHIDVVPPFIPYSISDEDDPQGGTRISGRGTVDAKGSVAAQLTALVNLLEQGAVRDEVMVLYVVGEEVGGEGMRFFSDSMASLDPAVRFDSVIFGEPTENRLACGHKGGLFCTIEAEGAAGHSGYPWLGKSANELMVRALAKMLDADLGSSERGGNTTVNVGRFDGGVAANVIPKHAEARIAVRVATGPEKGGEAIVRKRIREIFDAVDEEAFSFACHGYGFVDCDCDVDGFRDIVVNYGTDIPNMAGGHTRYLYGPGNILVAHGDNENLTVADLETAVKGYEKLILHALEKSKTMEEKDSPTWGLDL